MPTSRSPRAVGSATAAWSWVGASEMIDHFSAMRERGVERFYVWFTDFASPATLEAFGAEVISAF